MLTNNITLNADGKPAKRNNHTVPKALLKRWLTTHQGQIGHWVLECTSNQVSFKPGSEARFAISDYRFVPVREDDGTTPYRDEAVENWFSRGENDLALITDLLLRKAPLPQNTGAIGGFVQAVILLGYRSAYEYLLQERLLGSTDASLSEWALGRKVVDHFRRTYSQKLEQFKNWDYRLFFCTDEQVLVCDRPLFDMTVHHSKTEMLLIPLSPSLILVASPPKDRSRKDLTLTTADLKSSGIAALANKFTIERARQFVIGTPELLLAIQSSFHPEAFAARMASDQVVRSGRRL